MRVSAGRTAHHGVAGQRSLSGYTLLAPLTPRLSPRQHRPRSHRARLHAAVITAFKSNSPQTIVAPNTAEATTSELTNNIKQQLTVSWAGAGIFFFWQLGCMKFLAEKYDLTRVPMSGASGGALASVLAACGVNADRVIDRAYEMSLEHNIWKRPLGLVGLWGKLIEQWLDDLLPDNAHEICRDRITVVVTTLPDMGQVGISDFKDKKDLINACMASAHIPFFLDYRLTRKCRGKQCVDGSFPDFFTGLNSELLRMPGGMSAIVFDYFDDTSLKRKGRLDMLEVKSYDEIRRMYDLGYQYAKKLHMDGRFDHYELAEVLLQGQHGHMSEVLVPEHSNNGNGIQPQTPSVPQQQLQEEVATAYMNAVVNANTAGKAAASQLPASQLQRTSSGEHRLGQGLVLELQQDGRELQRQIQQQQQL